MANQITVAELKIMVDGLEYRINRLEGLQKKTSAMSRITKGACSFVHNGFTNANSWLPKIRRVEGGFQFTTR